MGGSGLESENRVDRAANLLGRGDFAGVIHVLGDLTGRDCPPLEELRLIGLAAILGNMETCRRASMTAFERLSEKEKSDTLEIWARQAAELLHYRAAGNLFYPLVEANPDDPDLLARLAYYYLMAGHVAESAQTLERAKHFGPDRPTVWQTAISIHETMGDLNAARASAQRALELDPLSIPAFEAICSHTRNGAERALEVRFLNAVESGSITEPRRKAAVLFAAARSREKQGSFAKSFEILVQANQIQRSYFAASGQCFSEDQERADFDEILRQTSLMSASIAAAGGGDRSNITPIFVVGMPRSGSTLLERILGAHPLVCPLGERPDIPLLYREFVGRMDAAKGEGGALAAKLGELSEVIADLRLRYLNHREIDHGRHRCFIDKLPDNFRYLGFIRWLFPESKIIVTGRDPRDVALSIFATPFHRYMPYATDLPDIAAMLHCCRDALDEWQARGIDLLNVAYKSVVTDLEAEARRIIAHCGLDWDPACLAFQETAGPVHTASVLQVRQPLNRKSIGRWRNYESQLAPLIEALRARGLIEPEGDDCATPETEFNQRLAK